MRGFEVVILAKKFTFTWYQIHTFSMNERRLFVNDFEIVYIFIFITLRFFIFIIKVE